MWKEAQAEQSFAAAHAANQSARVDMLSMDQALRDIQASVSGAAAGAYPSEWLFASVSYN
ncbi:hypothetical protein ACKI2N_000440 [Cupriavidus sp. 30B13]|uniref:hypothetical protein n=1 Tax=Cupriavidus sp. 30B13 TaxID=3384241 RepID=UPI003B918C22